MKYRTSSINGLAGSPVTFVGFGVTVPGNPNTTGTKMAVASTIGKVASQGFFNYTSPANPKNTCTGDSGGPAVLNTGGIDEVISVVSGGDEGCVENGFNTRVDIHGTWLQQLITQHDPGAAAPVCGNGTCESGEDSAGCPADCGRGACGDISYVGCCEGEVVHWCENAQLKQGDCAAADKLHCGWNSQSQYYDCGTDGGGDPSGAHPKGCGSSSEPECGDGECQGPEDSQSCPSDCGPPPAVCGDGKCEGGESEASCPADCGAEGEFCGNGQCETGESEQSCPEDCSSPGVCGDGDCRAPETSASCPLDCDITTTTCGDGVCESPETERSCPGDCERVPDETCGDGQCSLHETCFVCPSDCGSCEEEDGGGCGVGYGPPRASGVAHALILLLLLSLVGIPRFSRYS